MQYQKLKGLGIKDLFGCIVLSSEVDIWKPDPRLFLKAIALLGKEPRECMYVGNSYEDDVLGAWKAGMRTCWLNPDGTPIAQKGYRPDYLIREPNELLEPLTLA